MCGGEDMKVTLRYTDCLDDGKNVFLILAKRNVKILGTRRGFSMYPKITIIVAGDAELNELLADLNRSCRYEVSVVKVHKPILDWFMYIIGIIRYWRKEVTDEL